MFIFNIRNALFIVLCTIVLRKVQCFTAEDLNTDLRFIKICNKTSPISMSTINEVLINKRLVKDESDAFKCFLHCLFTKYAWMDDDGGFLLHHIKLMLEEARVEIDSLEFILYKCTAIDSSDKCERSFLFTQCFWDKIAQENNGNGTFKNITSESI